MSPVNRRLLVSWTTSFPEETNPGPWLLIADNALTELCCLQIGISTMLFLEKVGYDVEEKVWVYRRVGLCTGVPGLFFASGGVEMLILKLI